MAFESSEPNTTSTTLTLANSPPVIINDEPALREGLADLRALGARQSALLARDRRHYIKAERWGELWSVTIRKGGFWTIGSFTAVLSTDWNARQVQEHRAAKSLLAWLVKAPPPERALSTQQVETLFIEFFSGKKFSLPMSGA